MRWSKALIPTLKEDPSDAEIPSHKLMFRSGMLLKLAAGIHDYQPLMVKALHKLEALIREEMDRIGGQEVHLPVLSPAELWKESKRWEAYGPEMMRIQDRHEREFVLGPTHEEVITDLVRRQVNSYRQLPLSLYQIQTKFRDEIRPRFGIMRSREFLMKDAYSFHASPESLDKTYEDFYSAYKKILDRIGFRWAAVAAEGGAIGGHFTQEFMVLADSGEEPVLYCPNCHHAVKEDDPGIEMKFPPFVPKAGSYGPLKKAHTPGIKTVQDLAAFFNVPVENVVKTLVFKQQGGKGRVVVLVRGDHDAHEGKLRQFLKWDGIELASPEEVLEWTKSPVGFLGPIGLDIRPVIVDTTIWMDRNLICGANEVDYHYQGFFPPVNLELSNSGIYKNLDVRKGKSGDPCTKCGKPVEATRGIEVGHIFKLGTKYSEALSCLFTDEKGQKKPMIMGCYGIGVTRIIGALIEQCHDDKGIVWPLALAPYHVLISVLTVNDDACVKAAEKLYEDLRAKGAEVLLDDRDVGAGFKFKDADLVGIPLRVAVGAKSLKEGKVEFSLRSGGAPEKLSIEEALSKVLTHLR